MKVHKAKTHELKTWPDEFQGIRSGFKHHEYRYDDRGFTEGDILILREWDPVTSTYSGESIKVRVSYLSRDGFGIPAGFCVMSIERVTP